MYSSFLLQFFKFFSCHYILKFRWTLRFRLRVNIKILFDSREYDETLAAISLVFSHSAW